MGLTRILGVYHDGASAARATISICAQQLGEVLVYSPTPDHMILETLQRRTSRIRLFTLIGAGLGCVLGVSLPVYTMLDWPLITGGKPLISIPPLIVIGFAVAMLFGALSALTGFLCLSRLPSVGTPALYDPRFSQDRFGVLVSCDPKRAQSIRACLAKAGAEEIKEQAPN